MVVLCAMSFGLGALDPAKLHERHVLYRRQWLQQEGVCGPMACWPLSALA